MIIEPDFLSHWKTNLLADLLGDDKLAPMYVIRFWAHCQQRRTDRHRITSQALAAICHYSQDEHEKFYFAMVTSGFVEEVDGDLVAHDWKEVNAKLFRSWNNGKFGGRPAKNLPGTQQKPTGNLPGTQQKPNENPKETHEKPSANPEETYKKPTGTLHEARREEKRREEKTGGNRARVAREEIPPQEDLIQHSEAQLALREIASGYFKQTLPASFGMVPGYDQALNLALPLSGEDLEALKWFYALPRDHPIFNDQRHPGLTSRRRSFTSLMQNLREECEKAMEAKKTLEDQPSEVEQKEDGPPHWRELLRWLHGPEFWLRDRWFDQDAQARRDYHQNINRYRKEVLEEA